MVSEMRTLVFLGVVLASGAMAGLVHGAVNLVLVEPYLDRAIEIENRRMFESGAAADTPGFRAEYEAYRDWQKGGQVLAGAVLGTSMGALLGIVYALSRGSLPGGRDIVRAPVLAGIMWAVLHAVPSLRYPADPPAVGDPETVALRTVLYVVLVAVSGLGALGSYGLSRRLPGRRKLAALAAYAALVSAAVLLMPAGPGGGQAPGDLVAGFRAASAAGVASFWAAAGLILGLLWGRFLPGAPRRG